MHKAIALCIFEIKKRFQWSLLHKIAQTDIFLSIENTDDVSIIKKVFLGRVLWRQYVTMEN